jgi:hypothetical protein
MATHYVHTREGLITALADSSGTIHLIGNIDLAVANWTPINTFTGIFEGNGYRILNMTVDAGTTNNAQGGLFAALGTGAIVRNLGITGTVTAIGLGAKAGGLVGVVSGNNVRISNCSTSVNVDGFISSGGLIGEITGTGAIIVKCYSTGTVHLRGSGWAGGLIGTIRGEIRNCFSTGNVTSHTAGRNQAFGYATGTFSINQCYFFNTNAATDANAIRETTLANFNVSTHAVYATGTQQWQWEIHWNLPSSALPALRAGNKITTIVGMNNIEKDLNGSYSLGSDINYGGAVFNTIGTFEPTFNGTFNGCGHRIFGFSNVTVRVGSFGNPYAGIFGGNKGTIRNLNVSGTINSTTANTRAGGLVGWNQGTIEDCRVSVNVTSPLLAGGFVAQVGAGSTIRRCFATGNTTTNAAFDISGGFVAHVTTGSQTFRNCFSTGTANARTTSKGGFAGTGSGNFNACYYSGGPNNGQAIFQAGGASSFYPVTHAVYSTGFFPWDFTKTGVWSNRLNTTNFPPFKAYLTGVTLSGAVTDLGNKAMRFIRYTPLDTVPIIYSTTSSSDNFSFNPVTPVEGGAILIYVNTGVESERSNLVGWMNASTGNTTGIGMKKGELVLGLSGSNRFGDVFTNTELLNSWYNDADIFYSLAGGVITIPSSFSVPTGISYSGNGNFVTIVNAGTTSISSGIITGDVTNSGTISLNTLFTDDTTFIGDINLMASRFLTPGKTYIFQNGKTYTYDGLSIVGEVGNEIILKSSSAGNRFTFDGPGALFIATDIKDCQASTSNIDAKRSINSGGNDNMESPPKIIFWRPEKAFIVERS